MSRFICLCILAILVVGLNACAASPAPTFKSCYRYIDANVSNVVTGLGNDIQRIWFENGSYADLRGSYGLTVDPNKISRITYRPNTDIRLSGLIENVRFIPEDSIGIWPGENLCPLTDAVAADSTK